MSNSRLILANKVFDNGTILNGTGGGTPALEETAPYVMTNAMTAGRRTKWQTSAAPASPLTFDVDLGAARAVGCAAVCGLRSDSGVIMGSCDVQWGASATGAWTTLDSVAITGSPRDAGVVFTGGSVTKRYWRFNFTFAGTGGFSLSSLWLGALTDLGGMHSPDAETSPFQNRAESQVSDGSYLINTLGDKGHDFTLPFNVASASLRTTMQAISDLSGSFVYIDPDGNFYEVIARGGRVTTRRSHATIYALGVELARLP